MAEVELYSTLWCPYCTRARTLLRCKGVAFVDIDINEEPSRRAEMIRRAGGRTSVPQIFIDGTPPRLDGMQRRLLLKKRSEPR